MPKSQPMSEELSKEIAIPFLSILFDNYNEQEEVISLNDVLKHQEKIRSIKFEFETFGNYLAEMGYIRNKTFVDGVLLCSISLKGIDLVNSTWNILQMDTFLQGLPLERLYYNALPFFADQRIGYGLSREMIDRLKLEGRLYEMPSDVENEILVCLTAEGREYADLLRNRYIRA